MGYYPFKLAAFKMNEDQQIVRHARNRIYHGSLEHLENSVHQDQQNLTMPDIGFFFYMHQTPTEDSYMNPQH